MHEWVVSPLPDPSGMCETNGWATATAYSQNFIQVMAQQARIPPFWIPSYVIFLADDTA